MNNVYKKMTYLKYLPDDILLSIFGYLNHEDIFYKEKTTLSRSINTTVQTRLKLSKIDSEVSQNVLLQYWSKKELENVPMVLYSPNKFGVSLRTRLFNIFDTRKPHKKLFISNVFTNRFSFMIRQVDPQILFIEFSENKLNYNVYTRPKGKAKRV